MKDYVLMMLATVIAIRLFWIGPICKAIAMGKQLTANLTFVSREESNGNNYEAEDSGV